MTRLRMNVKGQRALVVGLGKSGVASAPCFCERGATVAVSDAKLLSNCAMRFPCCSTTASAWRQANMASALSATRT